MSIYRISARPERQPLDLSLLPPVCYLTQPLNRLLLAVKNLISHHRWFVLPVFVVLYILALVMANIPALNWPRDSGFLIFIAPVVLPLGFILAYLGCGIGLLSILARSRETRLLCAAIILMVGLLPFLVLSLDDTWLMMKLGYEAVFILCAVQPILILFLGSRYPLFFLRHAAWCMPVMLLLSALLWLESGQAFSYSHHPSTQFTVRDCQRHSVEPDGYDRVHYQLCNVHFFAQERTYNFSDMPVPSDDKLSLEIRHALFDHYRIVPTARLRALAESGSDR